MYDPNEPDYKIEFNIVINPWHIFLLILFVVAIILFF